MTLRHLLVCVLAVLLLGGAASAATRARSASVSIVDNAFQRGQDRPVVRLRRGGVLTWHWRSQSSHQVVASGPERFRSPTRNDGHWSRRLRRAGRYRIVCSIHAPGMRMTISVR